MEIFTFQLCASEQLNWVPMFANKALMDTKVAYCIISHTTPFFDFLALETTLLLVASRLV